jgi:hypothetical protein
VVRVQITTTDKAVQASGIKCLIYGRAGMGKTTLASTVEAPLIISAESGLLSVRRFNLPVVEVKTVKDVDDVYDWLRHSADARFISTVFLDSLSEILEIILFGAKIGRNDPRQAYGKLIDEGTEIIKKFRDLPRFNVVMTAKEYREKDNFGGGRITPRAPGQSLGIDIPYMYDLVARATTGTAADGATFHYLQCRPDDVIEAKDRSGALDKWEPPNLSHVFGKIRAAFTQ